MAKAKKENMDTKRFSIFRLGFRLVLIIILFFLISSLFLYLSGKQLIESSLTSAIGRKVTIGKLFYDFPFGLRAFHLNMEGILKSKDVKIQFDVASLARQEVNFSYVALNAPIITIDRENEIGSNAAAQQSSEMAVTKPAADTAKPVKKVLIGKLLIVNGRFVYEGDIIPGRDSLVLERVSLTVNDLVLPLQKGQLKFDGAAQLEMPGNPFDQSRVRLTGWMDWVSRNADMDFVLAMSDGQEQIKAKMTSENNQMKVNGEMDAKNMLFGFMPPGGDETSKGWMKSLSFAGIDNIMASFAFETAMDHPKIIDGGISFNGKIMLKE